MLFQSYVTIRKVFCTLLLLALSTLAQGVFAATIDRVLFIMPPDDVVSETYLRAQIQSAAGVRFTPELLADDIRRLYETGIISDVEAEVVPVDDERVAVRFNVTPTPEISDIVISGNQEIRTSRVRDKFPLNPGERLDSGKLIEGRNEIRQLYEGRGFHQARITIHEERLEDGRVHLHIEIQEDERYKIRSVEFSGNEIFSDRQLRRVIRSRPSIWAYLFSTGHLNQEVLEADRRRLQRHYHDQGHLDFRVTDIELDYSRNDKWVNLTLQVEEGQPYRVASISIEGNQIFSDEELRAGLSLRESSRYSLSEQEQDLQWLNSRYSQLGHLDFVARPVLQQDGDRHTVDMTYQIREGQPARIRDIFIVGNEVTQDHVLRREVSLEPGDLADSRKIENSRARLRNLEYFETVRITPLPTEDEELKDLEIAVEERMTGRWGIGGGVSSDTGVFGFFEVQDTNFDISKLFRFREWPPKGAGQRASFRANIGTEINEFVLSFTEPWLFGYRLRFQTDLYMRTFDQGEYDEERIGSAVSIARTVALGPDRHGRLPWWRQEWRQSFGYRLDRVNLSGFKTNASDELLDEEGNYIVSALSFGLNRDTRDSFVMPTRGGTIGMSVELQSEAIGAYSNIYKLNLRGSQYLSLRHSPLLTDLPILGDSILKLSGEISSVDSIGGDDPAIFDRYFAGGQYSFRGFGYRQVSPADVNDDPVGGRSRLLATTELMYPLHETLWVSVFADVGNVWRSSWGWNPGDLNASVGLGLQLNLRALPVRIDFGAPVLTRQDHLDTGGRLHFSLGRSF